MEMLYILFILLIISSIATCILASKLYVLKTKHEQLKRKLSDSVTDAEMLHKMYKYYQQINFDKIHMDMKKDWSKRLSLWKIEIVEHIKN